MAKQLFKTTPPAPLSPIGCSDRATVLQDLENDFNPHRKLSALLILSCLLTEQYSKIVYPKRRKANLLAVVLLLSLVCLICRQRFRILHSCTAFLSYGARVWLDLPQVHHTSFTLSRTKEFFKSPGSG